MGLIELAKLLSTHRSDKIALAIQAFYISERQDLH